MHTARDTPLQRSRLVRAARALESADSRAGTYPPASPPLAVLKRLAVWGVLAWLALPASAASLTQLVQQAWERTPEAASSSEQEQLAASRQQLSQRWLAGSAAMELEYEHAPDAAREAAVTLALPLWRSGQREQQLRYHQAAYTLWQHRQRLQRWELAGAVREAVWDVRLAEHEVASGEKQLAVWRQLQQDAQKREQAGELPPLQLNQARLAVAGAEASQLQLQLRLQQARNQLQQLTGSSQPATDTEAPQALDPAQLQQQHPLLAGLRAEVDELRLHLPVRRAELQGQPELAVGISREQPEPGAPAEHALRLSLRLPLTVTAEHQPLIHESSAAMAAASARLQRETERLQLQLQQARQQLQLAQESQRLAEARLQLARQNRDWQSRAWQLGELELSEWLRSEQAWLDAEQEAGRAVLELGRASARLNQIQGVMP